MGGLKVTRFLTSLAVESHVAGSTQSQALSALLFLYREVLAQELPWLDDVVRAKWTARLPVVLTRDELRAIIRQLRGVHRLMAILLYGAGLRLLEAARVRVKDVAFYAQPDHGARGKGRQRPGHAVALGRDRRPGQASGYPGRTARSVALHRFKILIVVRTERRVPLLMMLRSRRPPNLE